MIVIRWLLEGIVIPLNRAAELRSGVIVRLNPDKSSAADNGLANKLDRVIVIEFVPVTTVATALSGFPPRSVATCGR